VASNISCRPLFESAGTGRCFCSSFSDSVKNLTNVVIGKLGKLGHKQNCSHDFFIFLNYNIIIVQVRYITIERKDVVPYWT
jgi:hypothetical protein